MVNSGCACHVDAYNADTAASYLVLRMRFEELVFAFRATTKFASPCTQPPPGRQVPSTIS